MNKLYFGDNLSALRDYIRPESVDLIYLDPPFNSNASYGLLFKDAAGEAIQAQAEAFRDTWAWGEAAAESYDDVLKAGGDVALALRGIKSWIGQNNMMAYLAMMAARIIEMRDVLKSTGSIYLHCDPKASHYLKMIMDAVFGHESFQNEIVWKRSSSHNRAKRWGPVHDNILFYTKSSRFTWNRTFSAYEKRYLDSKYRHKDDFGNYRLSDLTGPGIREGDCGMPWGGIDPKAYGRHWEPPHDRALPSRFQFPIGWSSLLPRERLQHIADQGFIRWPEKKGGKPEFKRYLESAPGQPVQDVITDIDPINSMAQERLGYPTQKPISLLERIISCSSNEGDVILDPFCGCGTTIEASERMKRQWVGIDVTHYAITLIEERLKTHHPKALYKVEGRPKDLASAKDLARRDKHQFQWWAAWKIGSQTYKEDKKGADRGIDGNILFKNGPFGDGRIIVSVKGGENVGSQMVRDLRGVIEREEAELGVLITLTEPTAPMMREAADAGFLSKSAHGRLPRLQIVRVEDMLLGRLPKLPPLPQPERKLTSTIKKKDRDQLELLLPFEGEKIVPSEGVIVDPRFVRLAG